MDNALTQAMRLTPYPPDWQLYNLSLGYAWAGESEREAIGMANVCVQRLPTDPYGYTNLAIVQAFSGINRKPQRQLVCFVSAIPVSAPRIFDARNIISGQRTWVGCSRS